MQIVGAPPPYSQATANAGERENHASADLPPPYRAEEEAQVDKRLPNFLHEIFKFNDHLDHTLNQLYYHFRLPENP